MLPGARGVLSEAGYGGDLTFSINRHPSPIA